MRRHLRRPENRPRDGGWSEGHERRGTRCRYGGIARFEIRDRERDGVECHERVAGGGSPPQLAERMRYHVT